MTQKPVGAKLSEASTGMTQTITLRDMKFHTLMGVYDHEQEYPQPLEIDLIVRLTAGFVDYVELYEIVSSEVSDGPHRLLEDLAAKIIDRVYANEIIEEITLSMRKPHVSLPGPLSYAEVTFVKSRLTAGTLSQTKENT